MGDACAGVLAREVFARRCLHGDACRIKGLQHCIARSIKRGCLRGGACTEVLPREVRFACSFGPYVSLHHVAIFKNMHQRSHSPANQ